MTYTSFVRKTMQATPAEEPATLFSLANLCHTAVVVSVIALLFPVLVNPGEWVFFTWHPALMSAGTVGLMSEGIILTAGLKTKRRSFYLNVHLLLQLLSLIAVLAAFTVIYVNKNLAGKLHFQTWHSWVSLGATVLMGLQNLTGLVLYFFSFLSRGCDGKRKAAIKKNLAKFHRYSAVVAYIGALAAVGFGLRSNWALKNYGSDRATYMVLSLVVFTGASVLYNLSFLRKLI
mmetsp:Transcript_13823/g.39312  ORF Transcript_13823/g.39312 Transcript_13823/m.39312 type:complete len:232 (+) Transcript_13823:114-809(+)|eukprot:CAMPEP_0119155430 /NCGR_PEP_ID=MMETSP1310-20130426/51744_1 /TAXON_ID=464262 /ORGANISM="Genus nov. species nov., Strain RCC2339" /LENGTH=231 /DNA_ID=CAMNT_0007148029 /DNA_START=87 /DNA_END=782 /DNA_ORIENTATION=+